MTRGHRFDMECLTEIFRKPYAYVGMMGSKKRAAIVKKTLKKRDFHRKHIRITFSDRPCNRWTDTGGNCAFGDK